jgi:hypothetical protein
MRPGGASCHGASIRAFCPNLNRGQACGHIRDHHGNHKGTTPRRAFIQVDSLLIFEDFNAANATADNHTHLFCVQVIYLELCIGDRLQAGRHPKLGKSVHAFNFLAFQIVCWIESLYLSGYSAGMTRRIKQSNEVNAITPCQQPLPILFQSIANRRNRTEPRNNNTFPFKIGHNSDSRAFIPDTQNIKVSEVFFMLWLPLVP